MNEMIIDDELWDPWQIEQFADMCEHYQKYSISMKDFMRLVFPEGSLEKKGEQVIGLYNGLILVRDGKKTIRHYLHDGHEALNEGTDFPFDGRAANMAFVGYCGKATTNADAMQIFGLTIPLKVTSWNRLEFGILKSQYMPTAFSFTSYGAFVYYLFEKPLPLYDSFAPKLQKLYDKLYERLQRMAGISIIKKAPSILSRHALPGTMYRGEELIAYHIGKKFTVEALNELVPSRYRFTYKDVEPTMTLEEAKEKHPQWYRRAIQKKGITREKQREQRKKAFNTVYQKYLDAAQAHTAKVTALEALAAMAVKCKVIEHETLCSRLESLSYALRKDFNVVEVDKHLYNALGMFRKSPEQLNKWKRETMNEWSGVFLEGSTRNGLTQDAHLNNLANSRRTDKLILEWYENNPNGTCQECSDATGISLRTVKKYHPGREKPYKPKKAAPKKQRIPKTCPDCGGELIKEIEGPWVCKVECCAQGRQYIKTKRICTQCGTVAYEKVSEYHEKNIKK